PGEAPNLKRVGHATLLAFHLRILAPELRLVEPQAHRGVAVEGAGPTAKRRADLATPTPLRPRTN
ncbi:MAG TPA: hypothetical protein VEH77_18270, partial [Roseiarcus sp.]|nr:hypothetical protein [Roseiarcus sp.]